MKEAPQQEHDECRECTNNNFCSNCFVRTINKVKEMNKSNEKCNWFNNRINDCLRNHIT